MTIWTYRGRRVHVSPIADIPNALQQGSKYDYLVQQALESFEPWHEGENPFQTVQADVRLWRPVVSNQGQIPEWGVYRGHRFRYNDVSPFVRLSGDAPRTRMLTVELTGTPAHPVIVRAYPGYYLKPLPWQENVYDLDASVAFWRTHSFVLKGNLVKGELTTKPPSWFTP